MDRLSACTFLVGGMTCGSCVSTVEKRLKELAGVQEASVSLATEECRVVFKEEVVGADAIKEAIEDCGFDAELVSRISRIGGANVALTSKSTSAMSETQLAVLSVQGMTCGSCVGIVTKQLEELDGVETARVSLATEEAAVTFLPEKVSIEELRQCVEDCGFDCSVYESSASERENGTERLSLRLVKDGSVGVEQDIENQLTATAGIERAEIDATTDRISVEYNPHVIGVRSVVTRLNGLGLDVVSADSFDNTTQIKTLSRTKEIVLWRRSCARAGVCMLLILFIYKLIPMWFPGLKSRFIYAETPVRGFFYRDLLGILITSYVQFIVGAHFYKAAIASWRHGAGTMDSFVCVSTTCAFLFSLFSVFANIWNGSNQMPMVVFDTSAMLIGFVSVGKLLENKAKSSTSTALKKLISLAPSTCTILEDGVTKTVPVDFLQVGDLIEVQAGGKVPADGVVLDGETEVDESLMTGESFLVPKTAGSLVVGGSINGPGLLRFRTTKIGKHTKLAHIINTMKQAQLSKAPMQNLADYLASKFVPFILILSLVTFVMWYILCYTLPKLPAAFETSHGRFYACLRIAMSVVVVACPCALGLAAPTAIMVGTGVGAKHGVLIKGGQVLEKCDNLDVFVFDKTGTLTTGKMEVERFVPLGGHELTLEEIACINAAEANSGHPIAKAVVKFTEKFLEGSTKSASVTNHEVIVGGGLRCDCEVDGAEYHLVIGKKAVVPDFELRIAPATTMALVVMNEKVLGYFELMDYVKKDSFQVVDFLVRKGFKVCMVTGDNHEAAMKVAQEVGIDANNVYSEVAPDEKNDIVMQLQEEGSRGVAFIGDGINDSPALVTSDLGVSISTGTDIAMEAADVILIDSTDPTHSSLKGLVYALDIAHRTFRRVKMNFFWAMCYNICMLPIAMGVLIPWGISIEPLVAGAAMAASSVSVVCSSLLLNTWKPPKLDVDGEKTFGAIRLGWLKRIFKREPRQPVEDIELQAGLLQES
ncbi:LAMI_0E12948g1_1 [Lachancea mirantina]|uniref:P-type Cu(+) transporter n=1 Tax=Lachancea mirantina TaxID=1230905 RepID=A0A1G4JQP8_9SACH|nr:LAMI_0E12948g1_1 [Lachancea mirantina]